MTDEELNEWVRARSLAPPSVDRRDDLKLAIGCGRGDVKSLQEFENRYTTDIEATARRFGNADFARDVGQLVKKRLLIAENSAEPRITEYVGRGELKKFVQAVTTRVALNHLDANARHAQVQGDEALLDLPTNVDDPELTAMKLRYRTEFKQAFLEAMGTLDEQLRSAIRLHYLDGLTLAEIGALYGWSVPTASRRVAAAREGLLTATRRIMSERLKLSAHELDSVLRLIESKLSIDALALEPTPAG